MHANTLPLDLNDAEAEHKSAAASTPKRTFKIPADWQPNEVNRERLTQAGMSSEQQAHVVGEFVLYWRNADALKSAKNWQITFARNPVIKKAVASAMGGNRNGTHPGHRQSAHDRDKDQLADWAERNGLDPADLGLGR